MLKVVRSVRIRCYSRERNISALNLYKNTFPGDAVTINFINQYVELDDLNEVNVGVIYTRPGSRVNRPSGSIDSNGSPNESPGLKSNSNKSLGLPNSNRLSKFLPSILSDPLSSGNSNWFNCIDSRSINKNNVFTYSDSWNMNGNDGTGAGLGNGGFLDGGLGLTGSQGDNQGSFTSQREIDSENSSITSETSSERDSSFSTYKIPSPILSGIYRQNYSKLSVDNRNSIKITEINNDVDLNNYHFLINITPDLHFNSLPDYISSKVLFTIIDNTEYSPISSESTPTSILINGSNNHIIKINSQLAYNGIQKFLTLDTKASSEFINSLHQSNLFEVLKAIDSYVDSNNLSNWLLNNIITRINKSSFSSTKIEELNDQIVDRDINKFSDFIHHELQYEFIPNTTKYFKSKLSWWKLYLNNDNVEYDLKDYFNKNFMSKSIEKYNYLRGYISSTLKQNEYSVQSNEELSNPLHDLKVDLINNRLESEVQPKVLNYLTQGFVYYQLPISLIAWASWQYFGFGADTAIALGLLGLVAGINHVSKLWYRFTESWLQELFEQVRLCLGQDCIDKGLLKELNIKVAEESALVKVKSTVLSQLTTNSK